MNIPENILQQVADEAFETVKATHLVSPKAGYDYAPARRAVIQHALSNPALAPFLAGGIGVYTDAELMRAWNHREYRGGKMSTTRNLRAFIAALPRRESPALAEAIARAEKAEKEIAAIKASLPDAEATPSAEPEPDAQVPLGPEDVPPGSVFRFVEQHWYNALYVSCEVVCLISGDSVAWKDWNKLQDDGWQINTSLPDTGRWDANAWRPCSKPGKEVTSENTSH